MITWDFKNRSSRKVLILLFLLSLTSLPTHSAEPLQLKPGLWEGIHPNSWNYNLLELAADGKHRFFNANIPSAFKKVRFWNFTDDQITCTYSECIINIDRKNRGSTRLIISPYIESSFKVLEINVDVTGVPILTQTYQLDQKKAPSTIRSFIDSHKEKIDSLNEIQSDGIYGFWLGFLWLSDKPELISLEVHRDTKSKLTLFINGQNYVNTAVFVPEKITEEQGVIAIETEFRSFTSQLIINQLSDNQLNGYIYSVHQGKSVQTGNFLLSRMK